MDFIKINKSALLINVPATCDILTMEGCFKICAMVKGSINYISQTGTMS